MIKADILALGIPLLASMYVSSDNRTRSLIQIPVILYTVEQIFVGQFMIWYFKRWLARDKAKLAAAAKAEQGEVAIGDEEDKSTLEDPRGGIGGEDGTAGMAGTDGKLGDPNGLGGGLGPGERGEKSI